MIGTEWSFSVTSVYIYDSGSIVPKNFGEALNGFLEEEDKTRNRLQTLTI